MRSLWKVNIISVLLEIGFYLQCILLFTLHGGLFDDTSYRCVNQLLMISPESTMNIDFKTKLKHIDRYKSSIGEKYIQKKNRLSGKINVCVCTTDRNVSRQSTVKIFRGCFRGI